MKKHAPGKDSTEVDTSSTEK